MATVTSMDALNDLVAQFQRPFTAEDVANGWNEETRADAIAFADAAIRAISGRKPHERHFVRYLTERGIKDGPILYKVAVVERILNSGDGHPAPGMTPEEVFADRVAETVRYWVHETISSERSGSKGTARAPAALGQLLARLQPADIQVIKDAICYCAQGSAFGIMSGLDGISDLAVGYTVSVQDESTGRSILGDLHDQLIGRLMVRNEWVD